MRERERDRVSKDWTDLRERMSERKNKKLVTHMILFKQKRAE